MVDTNINDGSTDTDGTKSRDDLRDNGDSGNDSVANGRDGVFMNLTVPPGAEAGVDSLTIQYEGNELEVLVPPGSVAGDVLRIQVGVGGGGGEGVADDVATGDGDGDGKTGDDTKPSSNKSSLMDELGGIDDGEDAPPKEFKHDKKISGGLLSELGHTKDDDGCSSVQANDSQEKQTKTKSIEQSARPNITMISLGDGIKPPGGFYSKQVYFTVVDSLPDDRSQKQKAGSNGCNEGDGTNSMVWPSGRILAEAVSSSFGVTLLKGYIQRNTQVRCLELGSGSGVCGIALAKALGYSCKSTSKNTANVLLTDLGDPAVDLLKENIRRIKHFSPVLPSCVEISAQSLKWGDSLQSERSQSDEKFHLILGSDLLYNTRDSYDPLIRSIKDHLIPSEGVVLLAVRWRKPDLEREFFRMAESSGLKFELWKEFTRSEHFEKRSPCQLSWKEYGNPESDISNRFFHETMVSVRKTMKSLGSITEEDMDGMDDEEYKVSEEIQVQIYVGGYDRDEPLSNKKQRIDTFNEVKNE